MNLILSAGTLLSLNEERLKENVTEKLINDVVLSGAGFSLDRSQHKNHGELVIQVEQR